MSNTTKLIQCANEALAHPVPIPPGADPDRIDWTDLEFSEALNWVKDGGRATRAGWNGKGMFIFLVPGSQFKVNRPPLLGIYPEGTLIDYHAHIDMRTADGKVVPWVASQTDLLAHDWVLIDVHAYQDSDPGDAECV